MSYDSNVPAVPPVTNGGETSSRAVGQRQQWKLALEKAYLEIRESALGTEKDSGEQSTGHEPSRTVEKIGEARASYESGLSADDDGEPAGQYISSSGHYPVNGSPHTDKNAIRGLQQLIQSALWNSGHAVIGLKGTGNVSGKPPSAPVRTAVVPLRFEAMGNDGTARLHFTENGVQLVIRHGGTMSHAQLHQIIVTVRDLLKSQGLCLVKAIVDGLEFWMDEEPLQAVDDGPRPGGIDKIY